MFHLSIQLFGETLCFHISHLASRSSFSVLPNRGGAIHNLELSNGKTTQPIIAPYTNYEELLTSNSFRGAKLSPFPNRIPHGKYHFQDTHYQLPTNGDEEKNALHGLLYNQSFQQEHFVYNEERAILSLVHEYEGSQLGYPFPYYIQLVYSFTPQSLECTTVVKNLGTQPMPYGDGWHPYFQLTGRVDEWELQLPKACQQIILGADKIPTGEQQSTHKWTSKRSLNGEDLDHAFKLETTNDRITRLIAPQTNHHIELWQDESYPYLQVYTPEDRESIAIEPMSCNINAFNNGEGLLIMQPGQVFSGSFEIALKKSN